MKTRRKIQRNWQKGEKFKVWAVSSFLGIIASKMSRIKVLAVARGCSGLDFCCSEEIGRVQQPKTGKLQILCFHAATRNSSASAPKHDNFPFFCMFNPNFEPIKRGALRVLQRLQRALLKAENSTKWEKIWRFLPVINTRFRIWRFRIWRLKNFF